MARNPLAAHLTVPLFDRSDSAKASPTYDTEPSQEYVPVDRLESLQAEVDPNKVEFMLGQDPDDLPPLKVSIDEKGRHWVVDGNHRANAARQAGDDKVMAEVRRHPRLPQ